MPKETPLAKVREIKGVTHIRAAGPKVGDNDHFYPIDNLLDMEHVRKGSKMKFPVMGDLVRIKQFAIFDKVSGRMLNVGYCGKVLSSAVIRGRSQVFTVKIEGPQDFRHNPLDPGQIMIHPIAEIEVIG